MSVLKDLLHECRMVPPLWVFSECTGQCSKTILCLFIVIVKALSWTMEREWKFVTSVSTWTLPSSMSHTKKTPTFYQIHLLLPQKHLYNGSFSKTGLKPHALFKVGETCYVTFLLIALQFNEKVT